MKPLFYRDSINQQISRQFDMSLLVCIIFLLSLSFVMVYSASIATAEANTGGGVQYGAYLAKHGIFIAIGVMAFTMTSKLPTRLWQHYAPYLFVVGTLLLIVVLIPHVGKEVNGSKRWISLVVFNFQPSELMKFIAILYAADYTVRKAAHMRGDYLEILTKGLLPMGAVMLVVGGLLLAEPDFGAFAVITMISVGILFLGGFDWRLFAALILVLMCGFIAMIVSSPYRMQRVLGFLDPWQDPYGKGYQLSHSLIAFGRGEWTGVGLGASVEKLSYLPEAHTDFLMAIIAEELGLVGVLVVICAFSFLVFRAFGIGVQAAKLDRSYQALVAQGIGIWFGVQSFINIGVNMGLLPTKGLTLPLMSFGGSGIVANLLTLGVLFRIDWENRRVMRGARI
jgi:cell division protein FtsW